MNGVKALRGPPALISRKKRGAWPGRAEPYYSLMAHPPAPLAAPVVGHERSTAAMRVCAISVDLDEIHHYRAIHGLKPAAADLAEHAVYDRALPRFGDFARAKRLPLTLFVVGADVQRPENARVLRSLADAGHEL